MPEGIPQATELRAGRLHGRHASVNSMGTWAHSSVLIAGRVLNVVEVTEPEYLAVCQIGNCPGQFTLDGLEIGTLAWVLCRRMRHNAQQFVPEDCGCNSESVASLRSPTAPALAERRRIVHQSCRLCHLLEERRRCPGSVWAMRTRLHVPVPSRWTMSFLSEGVSSFQPKQRCHTCVLVSETVGSEMYHRLRRQRFEKCMGHPAQTGSAALRRSRTGPGVVRSLAH